MGSADPELLLIGSVIWVCFLTSLIVFIYKIRILIAPTSQAVVRTE